MMLTSRIANKPNVEKFPVVRIHLPHTPKSLTANNYRDAKEPRLSESSFSVH